MLIRLFSQRANETKFEQIDDSGRGKGERSSGDTDVNKQSRLFLVIVNEIGTLLKKKNTM